MREVTRIDLEDIKKKLALRRGPTGPDDGHLQPIPALSTPSAHRTAHCFIPELLWGGKGRGGWGED